MTPEGIVDAAIRENLKVIAIADHNAVGNVRRALKHAECAAADAERISEYILTIEQKKEIRHTQEVGVMRKDIPHAERTYLAVPYAERHEAKTVRARWDAVKKAWYVGPEADREKIVKWEPKHQPAPTLDPQKYLTAGTKSISLEEFRKVLGLESVKDADGNIIQEAPLQLWANFRQRSLDTAIAEINEKTDLNISLELLGRSKHRRVTTLAFALKAQGTEGRLNFVRSRSAASARLPDFVEPMKAKLVNSMWPGDWIYEIKFDGYRALALRGGSETTSKTWSSPSA